MFAGPSHHITLKLVAGVEKEIYDQRAKNMHALSAELREFQGSLPRLMAKAHEKLAYSKDGSLGFKPQLLSAVHWWTNGGVRMDKFSKSYYLVVMRS